MESLSERYGQTSVETRFLNLQTLLSIRKGEEESIQMYITRAWQLFNKVNSSDYAVKVKTEGGKAKIEDNPFVISELVFVAIVNNGLPLDQRTQINRRLVVKQTLLSDLDAVIQSISREGTREMPIEVASTELVKGVQSTDRR